VSRLEDYEFLALINKYCKLVLKALNELPVIDLVPDGNEFHSLAVLVKYDSYSNPVTCLCS